MRRRFALLILAALLPLLPLPVGLALSSFRQQRATMSENAVRHADELLDLVESELRTQIEFLRILSRSPILDGEAPDLRAFQEAAAHFQSSRPNWDRIILLDLNGQQMVNTAVPFGTPLLRRREDQLPPHHGNQGTGGGEYLRSGPLHARTVHRGRSCAGAWARRAAPVHSHSPHDHGASHRDRCSVRGRPCLASLPDRWHRQDHRIPEKPRDGWPEGGRAGAGREGRGARRGLQYGFAKASGGLADIASRVGHGTTVTLYLPEAHDLFLPTAVETEAPREGLPPRGARVLLVDDNDEVRAVAADFLKESGLEVRQASNAQAAIANLEQGEVEILVSDIVMPGEVDGFGLAKEARRRWPSLPILLVSGYSASVAEATQMGFAVLSKPFEMSALSVAVRKQLDAASLEHRAIYQNRTML